MTKDTFDTVSKYLIYGESIMKKRKNIALFVAMLEDEYSYSICEGALLGAKEIDANLFIFPAGILNAVYESYEYNRYRYQYNTLFSCIGAKGFDAVIIEYGTIASFLNDDDKKNFLKTIDSDIPTILLGGHADGFSSVLVNNRAGLREAVNHLIAEHECKRIGFLSGPVDTNSDAKERLEVFYDTMREQGLEVSEDYVAYGNFSEYSEEAVGKLLDRHPDLQAIVCANDNMAIGVYKELRKRGLTPGKDIKVTGFDNSPVAMLLEPNLTTVKADAKELAYKAIIETVNVIENKRIIHEYVDSQLLINTSCGCNNRLILENDIDDIFDDIKEVGVESVSDRLFEKYFNSYFENNRTIKIKNIVRGFFEYYFNLVDDNGGLHLDTKEFKEKYEDFTQVYKEGYIDLEMFLSVGFVMEGCLLKMISAEYDKLLVSRIMSSANLNLIGSLTKHKLLVDDHDKNYEVILTNVVRDMIYFSKTEKDKYQAVLNKFHGMNAPSGYLFTYAEGINHKEKDVWKQPDKIYVKAYYNGDDVHVYEGLERPTDFNEIFTDRFVPKDRRFDILVTPLYSGERQYGIMMVETELEKFRLAFQLSCQVSISIDVLDIINKQNAIKRELEINLEQTIANNKILDEMSRSDPLTGISNRRGFLDRVKTIMDSSTCRGKKAIAVYADMDNLKLVNDEFGHDDGDYALKTIAKALIESFRQSDVVARMGGDEFAAFALVSDDHFEEIIRERVKETLNKLNDNNDKPYYVGMSMGTYEFVIGEETNIDQILNKADADLYHEKKNKKKVLYKPGYGKQG